MHTANLSCMFISFHSLLFHSPDSIMYFLICISIIAVTCLAAMVNPPQWRQVGIMWVDAFAGFYLEWSTLVFLLCALCVGTLLFYSLFVEFVFTVEYTLDFVQCSVSTLLQWWFEFIPSFSTNLSFVA